MSSTTYKQDLVYESINTHMSMGEMVMILLYICMQPNGISFGYGGNFGYVMQTNLYSMTTKMACSHES